ncbi:MAG: signal peptidase II [Kiritimatiellaeota bacterium]|nr:signal peptidase II [Kiritimatiellota bacterium]
MLKRALPLALLFATLDQATKWVVVRTMALGESIPVVQNFFDISHVVNPGASWGIFAGWRYTLVVFAVVAFVLLAVFHRYVLPSGQPMPGTTLGLLLGGIAGNLVDRVRLGHVVDFIHVHWHAHSFPVFNVADMCITFGLAFYIAGQFAVERAARRAEQSSNEPG